MNILAFIYIKCGNLSLTFQSKITSVNWPLLLAVRHLTRLILRTNVPPLANSAAMALNSVVWMVVHAITALPRRRCKCTEVAVLMLLNVCVFDEQSIVRFDFFDTTNGEDALTFTSSDTSVVQVCHPVIDDDTLMIS
jgi:hypothetical protein